MYVIIKNREVWEETYVPERILYRDEAISKLNYFLKPALEGGRAYNILCVGDYGTGKTVCVRYVVRDLERKADGFKSYYINCAEYARERKSITVGRIITQCLREDGIRVYLTLPYEVKLDMFKKHILKYKSVVFILDEVDYYLSNKRNDFETFAYISSRLLPNTALVLITNKFWVTDYLFKSLDIRVQDTFSRRLRVVSFGDYTEDELYGILLDRARIGFYEGSYSDEVLRYIAHISYVNGWRARGVINIARSAAELAEARGEDSIKTVHVDEVANILPREELKEVIKRLDPPALNILNYLRIRKEALEQEVLEWFKSRSPKLGVRIGTSRSTFYSALSRLRGMGLVRSEVRGRGRGKGRYAVLRIVEDYYDLVEESLNELLKGASS